MKINNNIQALNALNQLYKNNSNTNKTMEKLSSGLRINKASDDAAGLAISEKMQSQIRGLSQAERNTMDGISLVQTAEGGLEEINQMAQRMRELSVQAVNDTNTHQDRQTIQKEIETLKQGINDIANDTEFNGINVLSPPTEVEEGKPIENKPGVDMVFLIDDSVSMNNHIDKVNEGLSTFVDSINTFSDTRIAMASILDDYKHDFIKDKEALKNQLDEYVTRIGRGGTQPYKDMIDLSPENSELNYRPEAKTVYTLLTDTEDESSPDDYNQDRVREHLNQNNIDSYVFGFGGHAISPFDKSDYETITGEDGEIYEPESSDDISGPLEDMTEKIDESLGDDNTPEVLSFEDIFIQTGANSGQNMKIELFDARTSSLGIDEVDVTTAQKAEEAITTVDEAIELIQSERSKFGSYQNRLQHVHTNNSSTKVNLTAADSRIKDADMAEQMTAFTKNNIINQSATAMLAQANQLPQGVLQLLH